jgi:hypothetical protein
MSNNDDYDSQFELRFVVAVAVEEDNIAWLVRWSFAI